MTCPLTPWQPGSTSVIKAQGALMSMMWKAADNAGEGLVLPWCACEGLALLCCASGTLTLLCSFGAAMLCCPSFLLMQLLLLLIFSL